MSNAPLTDAQKKRLKELEPKLRHAAKYGHYDEAKRVASNIQVLLRETGHETRLMQAKNWLFQAAMESGQLETARMGFEGVRKKTNRRTRVYLEATALEAVCLLRKGELDKAKPFMAEALKRVSNISSESRRKEFQKRMVTLFEEEWIVASLRQDVCVDIDVDEVQDEAARLLQSLTADEIEENAVKEIPAEKMSRMFEAYSFSRSQLPSADRLCLPSPELKANKKQAGRSLIDSVKRVLWKSLCDENSAVYKMWFEHGMMYVLDKKYLTAAIVATMMQMKLGYFALAASVAAIIMKIGIEVFCDRFEPMELMM